MFVEARISGVKYRVLMDTGASTSLISTDIIEALPESKRPVITSATDCNLRTANGSPMLVKGVATLMVELDGQSLPQKFFVAEMTLAAILGMDFMCRQEAVIDVGRRRVQIAGGPFD